MNCASQKPLVSVVIPTYNRAHCIRETIESVFAQMLKDLEIIVIDDGSTDGTKTVLSPYMSSIRYIYQKNRGLSGARNRGVQEARGEWLAFLDSDDLWDSEKLMVQITDLQSNPSAVLHTSNAVIFREHIGQEVNLFSFTGAVDAFGSGD